MTQHGHPVIDVSRNPLGLEQKYSNIELEGLAVDFAVIHLRLIILGRRFTPKAIKNRFGISFVPTVSYPKWYRPVGLMSDNCDGLRLWCTLCTRRRDWTCRCNVTSTIQSWLKWSGGNCFNYFRETRYQHQPFAERDGNRPFQRANNWNWKNWNRKMEQLYRNGKGICKKGKSSDNSIDLTHNESPVYIPVAHRKQFNAKLHDIHQAITHWNISSGMLLPGQ